MADEPEAPIPPEGTIPLVVFEAHIRFIPQTGELHVDGPYSRRDIFYAMLELARESVLQRAIESARKRIVTAGAMPVDLGRVGRG